MNWSENLILREEKTRPIVSCQLVKKGSGLDGRQGRESWNGGVGWVGGWLLWISCSKSKKKMNKAFFRVGVGV